MVGATLLAWWCAIRHAPRSRTKTLVASSGVPFTSSRQSTTAASPVEHHDGVVVLDRWRVGVFEDAAPAAQDVAAAAEDRLRRVRAGDGRLDRPHRFHRGDVACRERLIEHGVGREHVGFEVGHADAPPDLRRVSRDGGRLEGDGVQPRLQQVEAPRELAVREHGGRGQRRGVGREVEHRHP